MTELTAARIHGMIHDIVIAHAALEGKSRADADDANFNLFFSKLDNFLGELVAVPEAEDRNLVVKEVSLIFHGTSRDTPEDKVRDMESDDFLDTLLPETRAVAAMRYLAAVHRVTFDPSRLKNWDAFSTRYQDIILEA